MKKSSKIRNKFDLQDVSRILGVSYATTARMCRQGKIKTTRIAQKYYVSKRDLNEYMNTGNIFDKPEKVIIDVILGALKEANEENIKRLEFAVKQKIIAELEGNTRKNLFKIDRNNVKLTEFVSEEVTKQLKQRTEKIKAEFAEAKQL